MRETKQVANNSFRESFIPTVLCCEHLRNLSNIPDVSSVFESRNKILHLLIKKMVLLKKKLQKRAKSIQCSTSIRNNYDIIAYADSSLYARTFTLLLIDNFVLQASSTTADLTCTRVRYTHSLETHK